MANVFGSEKFGSENIMDLPMDLTLEQQFNLKAYEGQVKDLSPEQAQSVLLEVMRQLMIKENMVRYLIKKAM